MGKVIKRIKIHFVGYITQFDNWRFFGDDNGSVYKQLLSNAICRTEFVSNGGKLDNKLKELLIVFNLRRCVYS